MNKAIKCRKEPLSNSYTASPRYLEFEMAGALVCGLPVPERTLLRAVWITLDKLSRVFARYTARRKNSN